MPIRDIPVKVEGAEKDRLHVWMTRDPWGLFGLATGWLNFKLLRSKRCIVGSVASKTDEHWVGGPPKQWISAVCPTGMRIPNSDWWQVSVTWTIPIWGLQQNRECQYTPRIAIVMSNMIINHGIWWFQKHHPLLCQAPSELYIYDPFHRMTGPTSFNWVNSPMDKVGDPNTKQLTSRTKECQPRNCVNLCWSKIGWYPKNIHKWRWVFLSLLANWGS